MHHRSALLSARLRRATTILMAVAVLMAARCGRLTAADSSCCEPTGQDACQNACQDACQDERSYAVFDALFLQRNNATVKQPLIVDQDAPGVPLMSTGDLTSTIGTGARLLYGNYGTDDLGWEIGYLGVYGMNATKQVTSAGSGLASASPQFAERAGFRNGSVSTATGSTQLNSIECNLVLHEYDGGFNRRSGRPWQRCDGYDGGHVDWLAGFRWADVEDSALLALRSTNPTPQSTYDVSSSSNLFAGQVGIRGRMAFERWATEGWMKIGIAGTLLSQSQTMTDAFSAVPLRSLRSGDAAGRGMIAEMNWSAIYRIDDVWGFRVGYNLMSLTGLALAPDQWVFSPSDAAGVGTAVHGTGSLFLAGGSLGLEARW
ncbi:MAG: hypothetical protein ACKOHG_16930 [Planctomycetia bacterium]